MSIDDKIREIAAEILKVDKDVIKEESAIGDIPSWDSLNHLQIVAAVESAFGIQFTPDVMMELEDFGDIVAAVKDSVEK